MRVLVCGSRSWKDGRRIKARLKKLPRGSIIISGGAKGADLLAATVARGLGFEVKEFKPDWEAFGKSAGLKRNIQMLEEKPHLVIAFWDGVSTGTAHTLKHAKEQGVEIEIIKS
jgi:hypothetical protein